MMYQLISPEEIKRWVDITGESKNDFINMMVAGISGFVETYCRRKFITRSYTEFPRGRSYTKIFLSQYPVYSVTSLYIDSGREYGADSLIDTEDYGIDAQAGTIDLYFRSQYINYAQAVKVLYRAGLSRFAVLDEVNNYIDIEYDSTDYSVEVAAGEYDAEDLATAIQTALTTAISGAGFTCVYNHLDQRFKIAATGGTFILKWQSGSSADKSIATLIGFDSVGNESGQQSYKSTTPMSGLPDALKMAIQKLATSIYTESRHKDGYQDIIRQVFEKHTIEYQKKMPEDVRMILDHYRRPYF